LATTNATAQNYSVVKTFGTQMTGWYPLSPPVEGSDGMLYGTAASGEFNFGGVVFRIGPEGSGFTVVKYFANPLEGSNPSTLVSSGSILFGTAGGGSWGRGTIFKLSTDGSGYSVLKHFPATFYNPSTRSYTNSDGADPIMGLILSAGTLYGTTTAGGIGGIGTVFKINPDGSGYTVLKSFSANGYNPSAGIYTNTDGASPVGLTLSGSTLYGTTALGGSSGNGIVFAIATDGSGYEVLKNFSGLASNPSSGTYTNGDGANPYASLVLSGNILYGTASQGGSFGYGTIFAINTDGSGYSLLKHFPATFYSPSTGTHTNSDGRSPSAGLLLSGTTLYGTTARGGSSGNGTMFKLNIELQGVTIVQSE
jgi:uncharacterized repeat protein (TIGR03803 family)